MSELNPKKIMVSGFVLVSFLLYSVGLRNNDGAALIKLKPNSGSGAGSSSLPVRTAGGNGSSPPPSNTPAAATYKDGKYVGSVADAFYGNVQVEATIKGGKIVTVAFLQSPHDQPNSVYINQQAMPYLQQEAIQAQSAQVDGVSGATDTSQAFMESLSVALNKAM